MRVWDAVFERECHRHVETVCDAQRDAPTRDGAWRALLTLIAPRLEGWAQRSPVLRRCGLTSEDEARTVLVGVLVRLSNRDFENLRSYLARQPGAIEEEEAEAAVVEGFARLARLGASEAEAAGAGPETRGGDGGDDVANTPLRGWLLQLVRYVVKDHVKQRLGWSSSARAVWGLEPPPGAKSHAALERAVRGLRGVTEATLDLAAMELAVEYLPGSLRPDVIARAIDDQGYRVVAPPELYRSKRDLTTDAERLEDQPEVGARPPMTDFLTLGKLLAEIRAVIATFPATMQQALELWLDDEGWDEIAAQARLPGPGEARALVRAAQARLRERFRGDWPAFFSGR